MANEFGSESIEDKLKQYNAFNSSNMFTNTVNANDFTMSNRGTIESEINRKAEQKELEKLNNELNKKDDLLSRVQMLSTPTAPIATEDNPFPYLSKPVIDLAKYDTDKTAQEVLKEISGLSLDDSDKMYLKLLGARESDFRKNAGKGSYKGIYQFNKDALAQVGLNMGDYLADTAVQHTAALKYRDANLKSLSKYQSKIGTLKDGILITKNGIGAMAHLLGPGTVRDYFDGTKTTKLAQNGFKDGNGTHISEYLKMFAM